MALAISKNSVVSLHYKLTDDDGNVLEHSDKSGPLNYLHGAGTMIRGLEKALAGKTAGERLQVRVAPAEAYGQVFPGLVQTLERSAFKQVENIEVGMRFEAETPDGTLERIVVTKVEGNDITIDANHPLAGMALNFEIEILSVRAATPEEIDYGHAH